MPVKGGQKVDGAVVVQGAVLGGQVAERTVLAGCEYRWCGTVLYFDQGLGCHPPRAQSAAEPNGQPGNVSPKAPQTLHAD